MRTSQLLTVLLLVGIAAAACADRPPTSAEVTAASLHAHPGRSAPASGDIAIPGGFRLEPFARGAFPQPIEAQIRLRSNGVRRDLHIPDVSDLIAARLTIAEGGSVGWHRHPGSAIIIVQSGTFGVIEETDCVLRTYGPGEAVFHQGQGILDVGFNAGEGDMVAYVTFVGVPRGQPATIPVPPEEAPC